MFVVATNEQQVKRQFRRAFAKCELVARKPKVCRLTKNLYKVFGSTGNVYAVKFQDDAAGVLTCHCTCKAGQSGLVCYHTAAAYLVRRVFTDK